jgi:hypothetical protein
MVTDQQVQRLRAFDRLGLPAAVAAAKAGMDEKTARKYRRLGKLPSEVSMDDRTWRTRQDPFEGLWAGIEEQLALNPGLEAKALFLALQEKYPGRFPDGQLRTLQRRVKTWRASNGPAKEVFFAQVHHPGRLGASDFTHCTELGVTLQGAPFAHLIYHFVLTYSNWETCFLCFSESYESLSEGLQNALWELGGVPQVHRTDRLGACVQPGVEGQEAFKQRYQALLRHYSLKAQAIQAGKGNENGDVEQSHHRFKSALEQALLLRGSRDFAGQDAYVVFLRQLVGQRNSGRQKRLAEELPLLHSLPERRLEACKRLRVKVDRGSTVHVQANTYSVPSRLIGEWVEARLFADHLEVWYGQRLMEKMPRLRGRHKHRIDYRHVIDWLVRKPGAFPDYRYQADLFPSSRFRMAYDALLERSPERAVKEYLKILHLAARNTEAGVDAVLSQLFDEGRPLSSALVAEGLQQGQQAKAATEVTVAPVCLAEYDDLLDSKEVFDGDGLGREGCSGGLPEGTALADVPVELPGSGQAGAAGVAELRAVSAAAGGAGVSGAAEQAGGTALARLAVAVGEELVGVGPEEAAAQGGSASADAVGGVVPGPA